MSEGPQSTALFEIAGAVLGMLLGFVAGVILVRQASGHGALPVVGAILGSAILFVALMIGGSVLGNSVRR